MSNVPMTVPVVVQLLIWQGEFQLPSQGQGPPVRARPFEKGCVFSRSEKGQTKRGHLMLRLP